MPTSGNWFTPTRVLAPGAEYTPPPVSPAPAPGPAPSGSSGGGGGSSVGVIVGATVGALAAGARIMLSLLCAVSAGAAASCAVHHCLAFLQFTYESRLSVMIFSMQSGWQYSWRRWGGGAAGGGSG